MICRFCKTNFPESEIHESPDVFCYLFKGNRKGQKNQADKFGRHQLCKDCHDKYEKTLRFLHQQFLRAKAQDFAFEYFKEERGDDK